jgi:hypothetical protein
MAQCKGSASTIFGRDPAANIGHAQIPLEHSPKSQSVLDRAPRATPDPGADGRLPSPVPSAALFLGDLKDWVCRVRKLKEEFGEEV